MLKRFRLPILALGTALTLLSPASSFARDHDRERREHHHVRVYVGPAYRYHYYGPYYRYYGPYYRPYGYYDGWGYWHPY